MVEFKHIIRIANTDLNGEKKIIDALRKIRGVGFMFSNMICSLTNIKKNEKAGNLDDPDIKKLDDIIKDPL